MEGSQRRPLLVSKGWIQAVVLVMLVGFFILGLLAYRTYMAHPPVPQRVVDAQGRVLYTGSDISKGQQVFLHNGLMEYGSAFGHGAYLGPDFTADYLRRSSDLVKRSYGGNASDSARAQDDRGLPHQPLRQAHGDADAHRAAGPGLPRARAALQPLLLRPDDRARPAAQRDHRPHAAAPADRVLRLDGVGGVDQPPRSRLLLHEQLAVRAARRQQADGQRDRLVGAVADRAAGRHRPALRRLRALGAPAGMARARAGDAVLPRARRRRAHARRSARARGSSS